MKALIAGISLLVSGVLLLLSVVPEPVCAYNWLQFGGNSQHTGVNQNEKIINASNVSTLQQLFTVTMTSTIDGPVAYLSGVQTTNGSRDMVFGTTWDGGMRALDAHTGDQIWVKAALNDTCIIRGTNVDPHPDGYSCIVHSAAALDPNQKYVYSYSLDGKVHKYQVGDGTEIIDANWPEIATLQPDLDKESASLVFATVRDGHTYLYVPFASYPGDWGNYQGHIVAINLDTGAQKVFNMVCSNLTGHFAGTSHCPFIGDSVWARDSVVYEPALDKIFMTTANGPYSPTLHTWGVSVIALHPDGSGVNGGPLDSYTPATWADLINFDVDLGSTAPAILPAPPNSSVQHLALQSGKDGQIRLLNLENLSGLGGPGHIGGEIGPIINVPISDTITLEAEVRTAQVVWINPADGSTWVFISNDFGMCAYKLVLDDGGNPSLSFQWKNVSYTNSSSPHMANGVLYLASSVDGTHGWIRALDPLTGDTLWSDNSIGTIHWSVPVVDNGVLYISDENNHLSAYSVNGNDPQTPVCSKITWFPIIIR